MKVSFSLKNFFKSFCCYISSIIFIISAGLTAAPAFAEVDFPDGRDDEFGENNIVFYNPDGKQSYDDCFSEAGVVDGNTAREIAWNWFVTHTEAGISNNAAAIAGVLGNFQGESGFNPFSHTSGSAYYGIYQTNADGLKDTIDAKGWGQYWGQSISSIPADIVKEAIEIELEILISTSRWRGNLGFADNLTNVDHTSGADGAASYAELFEVLAERAVCKPGNSCESFSQSLTDTKVKALTFVMYSHEYAHDLLYQGVEKRRDYARQIFQDLGSSSGGAYDCHGGSGGIARDNGDINATALALAWPNRDSNRKYWESTTAYYNALHDTGIWNNTGGDDDCADRGGSCDIFVATVMRYSGADPNFPLYLSQQKVYLANHPEKYIALSANTNDYRPGDIRIENNGGHITVITQRPDGSFAISHASHCARTGETQNYYSSLSVYGEAGTIYRMKEQ